MGKLLVGTANVVCDLVSRDLLEMAHISTDDYRDEKCLKSGSDLLIII